MNEKSGDDLSEDEGFKSREAGFRRGAHHAVVALANAIKGCTTLDEAQHLADTFADILEEWRGVNPPPGAPYAFDVARLVQEAKRTIRGN